MARPEAEPKTELGARLRAIRIALGNLDRAAVATDLGVAKNSLAFWERGERTPDAEVLAAYQSVYGININWLLSGDGKMFGSAENTLHKTGGLLDRKRMERAIEAVCEGLGEHVLPPKTMAEIVLIAYDMLIKDEGSRDNIIKLVRAA